MKERVFVGVCNSQENVSSRFFWSLWKINKTYPMFLRRATHPWDIIRNNVLIDAFLKSDFDIFVKMDIDQEYPEGYFEAMVPLVEKYKVIGPLIYDRWQQNNFMPLIFDGMDYPNLSKTDISGLSGVITKPYSHTNLFYTREVLEAIEPPYYEARLSPDGLNRANHVDFDFLDKIKAAGYSIYTNLDVEVKHLVEIPIGGENVLT